MSLCFPGVYEPEMMWYTWLFEHEGQPRGGVTWRGLSQLGVLSFCPLLPLELLFCLAYEGTFILQEQS